MSIEIRLLLIADLPVLERVAEEVFDGPVERHWATDFLKDSRHQHLVVAVDDGVVVGMVSAVDHVHPDKPPQLWSNELGVAPTHRRRGIGRVEHGSGVMNAAWFLTVVVSQSAVAHPDAAQKSSSVTLYARYGLPVHENRGPATMAGVTSGSANVRLSP